MFWKIATNSEITNPELIKKSISRLVSILKIHDNQKLQRQFINDAIECLTKGTAVLQSLKVIRKILKMCNDSPNRELIDYILT